MTGIDPETIPHPPFDPWNFRPDVAVELPGSRLTGYRVEALDGRLGKVVGANLTPDDSFLVVATGWWVFGRALPLPAGTVSHIDHTGQVLYLDRSRSQVKGAPAVAPEGYDDPARRDTLADYYRATYH